MVENGKPWSFLPWAKIQETKVQQCAASLIGMFLNDKFKTIQCFICSNNNNISTVAFEQRKWIEFKWKKGVMLCEKWLFKDLITYYLLTERGHYSEISDQGLDVLAER